MIVTFFLKLGTFFINYFGKLDTLINTLVYVLLRAKKVGHQISVSFEKFDVVQALLSFF
jgi:hypothetical protein